MKYHVGSQGIIHGEKNSEEILLDLKSGKLKPTDKVWLPGWSSWQTISETHELTNPVKATPPSGISWFEHQGVYSFSQTLRTILLQPGNFSHLPDSPKFFIGFKYLFISIVINALVISGLTLASGLEFSGLAAISMASIAFILIIVASLGLSLFFAVCAHAGVRALGGQQPARTTFATLLLCQGAGILISVIPIAGIFLSVWPFISGIIGLAASQRISILKSTLIQITSAVISFIGVITVIIVPFMALLWYGTR